MAKAVDQLRVPRFGFAVPHSRPTIGPEEIRAVERVLRSGMIGDGEEVPRFEEEFAKFVGRRYAIAVNSGSAALHAVLRGLGVGPRDHVVIPSYVCAAVLNAVMYTGAQVGLCDVDPATLNPTVETVRRALRGNTRVVIVPHAFGLPADVRGILKLGVAVIEDCATALGAECGRQGTAAVYSFYATKMMATGQGGMVATSDRGLADSIRDLIAYDKRDDYKIRYNYRMSALNAALGRVQVRRIPEFVAARRRMAALYDKGLKDTPAGLPPREGHVYYRYVIRVGDVEAFERHMAARGVECKRPVYRPLHRYLPEFRPEDFPGSEAAHRGRISIPLYPSMTNREAARVVQAAREYFR